MYLKIIRVSVGQVGVLPGTVKMVTSANLSTITTAGFLNGIGNQAAIELFPSDVIECLYDFDEMTGTGTYKELFVSITNGVITLYSEENYFIKFAGQHTTTANATNTITLSGALSTDLAFVQMVDNGTNNVTVLQAAMTANTLTITFSGDPSTDAIINYQVIRSIT